MHFSFHKQILTSLLLVFTYRSNTKFAIFSKEYVCRIKKLYIVLSLFHQLLLFVNVILLIVQLAMKLKLQNILNEEVLEAFLQIGTLVEPTYYLSAVQNFSEMSFSILNTYSEIIKEQCIFDLSSYRFWLVCSYTSSDGKALSLLEFCLYTGVCQLLVHQCQCTTKFCTM